MGAPSLRALHSLRSLIYHPPEILACRENFSEVVDQGMVRALLLSAYVLSACRTGGEGASEKSESTPASSTARAPVKPPLADERIEVPGGAFKAGSAPGEAGRRPELEPRLYTVELGPYQMDRLPYPNDPAKPPLTGVGRDEAQRLCAGRGGRLCTELEWERACKGPESELFSTGPTWNRACAGQSARRAATANETGGQDRCASAFNVLSMGVLREWTASYIIPSDNTPPRHAAVRGAMTGAADAEHGCARRQAVDPDEQSPTLGFRCCKGPPNAAVVREAREGQTFQKARLSADRLQKLLSAHAETRDIAKDLVFFREPDAANTVVERGPGDRKGFLFTVSPLKWNPVAGAEFLVVSGRSGKDVSFVAVFFIVGDDEYRLASSFVMKDEVGPVALAYNGYIRPRLHFSTCWGCPGETGKIIFREPESAVIVQP